ncbi:MAG TPA: hypothetical protein VIV58_00145 [Kofleriaceae bacterium]
MSHCANYVLRSGGTVFTGSSRWGGKAVPSEVSMGPDRVLALLAEVVAEGGPVYSELMCEGAMFVDVDAKQVLLYGGEDLLYYPLLQVAYLRLVRPRWLGWTVAWATAGWTDIARAGGVELDRDRDRERLLQQLPPYLPAATPITADDYFAEKRFAVASIDGHHVHVAAGANGVLLMEPAALAAAVAAREPQPLVARSLLADGGIVVDTRQRRVRYWIGHASSHLEPRLSASYAGWDIARADPLVLAVPRPRLAELAIVVSDALTSSAPERMATFLAEIRERAAMPGVAVAAGATAMPPSAIRTGELGFTVAADEVL